MLIKVRVGKRYAIYIPKKIAKKLNIKEGDTLILRVSEGKIELEKVMDPIELAIKGKKFAKIEPEEIERVSIIEQKRKIDDIA